MLKVHWCTFGASVGVLKVQRFEDWSVESVQIHILEVVTIDLNVYNASMEI